MKKKQKNKTKGTIRKEKKMLKKKRKNIQKAKKKISWRRGKKVAGKEGEWEED